MESKLYQIILSGPKMSDGDIEACVGGISSGPVEAVFGDEAWNGPVDELTIKCQLINAQMSLRMPYFGQIQAGVDFKHLLMLYIAKQERPGLFSRFGKGTIAKSACELIPIRDLATSSPDKYIEHVIAEAERLGNKFKMTVRVEYFGDPHYARPFL